MAYHSSAAVTVFTGRKCQMHDWLISQLKKTMVQSESTEILLAYFDWPAMKYHCMNVANNSIFTLEKAVFRKWLIIVLAWKRPLTYFSLSKGINSSANHLSLFMLIYLPKHLLHWQSVAVCFCFVLVFTATPVNGAERNQCGYLLSLNSRRVKIDPIYIK